MQDVKQRLLEAAEAHVVFDGWSEATFHAAIADSGVDSVLAKANCPRGSVDLAIAYHKLGDARMNEALAEAALEDMRFRDKVAYAVKLRLELCGDKEIVRRGTTLFALPHYAAEGAQLIWGTADAIWNALGDRSDDVNWYTKRTTLSGVYASTILYWLGDDSEGHLATWAFLDRRIENVMQFEKVKAAFKGSVIGRALAGPFSRLPALRAPRPMTGFPGQWKR